MPFYTYILESEATGMLYIGQTCDVSKRLHRHNEGRSRYTKGRGPWELLHFISFDSRTDAILLEKKLKGYKNPKRVKEWIKNQSLKK